MRNLIISLGVVFVAFIGIILYVRNCYTKKNVYIQKIQQIGLMELEEADSIYSNINLIVDSTKELHIK
ncbi:MAG: hypothetical protein QM660_02540 [Dysgonomonas sp.]